MTANALRERILSITNVSNHLQLYFIKKDNTQLELANLNNNNTCVTDLIQMFSEKLIRDFEEFTDESGYVRDLSVADERNNTIYRYDYDTVPNGLTDFKNFDPSATGPTFDINILPSEIDALVVFLGTAQNYILLYQKISPVTLLKRNTFLWKKQLDKTKEDMLKITSAYHFFMLNGELYIKNLKTLEKFYSFHDVIVAQASKTLAAISVSSIICDTSLNRLQEIINSQITFARKLARIKSPILENKVSAEKIIAYTREMPKLRGIFKYSEDGKIVLNNDKARIHFINLLNDNILISELSSMYYNSIAKDIFE